jgi:DNA-binding CsgD family transcriptional regulator
VQAEQQFTQVGPRFDSMTLGAGEDREQDGCPWAGLPAAQKHPIFCLHCFKTNVELEALVKNLSDRELEVFELLGRGITTHQIAACLKLAPSTIETYRERLKTKLNVTSAVELERQAFLWTFQRRSDLYSTNPII